jgi:hypothetical protein
MTFIPILALRHHNLRKIMNLPTGGKESNDVWWHASAASQTPREETEICVCMGSGLQEVIWAHAGGSLAEAYKGCLQGFPELLIWVQHRGTN